MLNICAKREYANLTRKTFFNFINESAFVSQRKGAREQLDQNTSEMGGIMNNDNVDEDIVVDTLEVEQRDVKDKEFVLPGGQIIGLDQAVLQSVERCRKFNF